MSLLILRGITLIDLCEHYSPQMVPTEPPGSWTTLPPVHETAWNPHQKVLVRELFHLMLIFKFCMI